MSETLSIGQVAERTGLSVHTLRFYEKRVAAQIEDLTACLEMISDNVRLYESHVAHGTTGRLWI